MHRILLLAFSQIAEIHFRGVYSFASYQYTYSHAQLPHHYIRRTNSRTGKRVNFILGNDGRECAGLFAGTAMGRSSTMRQQEEEYDFEVLSEDPKCFLVHNFLSPNECKKFISKADNIVEENGESTGMKRSNAPKVSMQMKRLWPLPFLCLGAGIPPVIRLLQDQTLTNPDANVGITMQDIVIAAMPPISIAFSSITFLLLIIPKIIQFYADSTSRTSQSLALNTEQDCEFIRDLVDRASELEEVQHKWYQWEAPVITKYEKGALFSPHNDASPTKGSEWADLGGQRVVTVITYLNSCEKGGATKFDQLGFEVVPTEGSALVFFPADGETLEADGRTVHQSLEAVDEKYIVQLFGRCDRVPSPLGIPDSYRG